MKKIFFPKSSSSHRSERGEKSGARRENKTTGSRNVETDFRNSEHVFPGCERKVTETNTISGSSVLRRSRTLSVSSAVNNSRKFSEDFTWLRNRQRIPSSHGECDCSDCRFQFRDRDPKPERYNSPTIKRPHAKVIYDHDSCSPSNPSSPRTSISGQVFELYIDGDNRNENLRVKDHRPMGAHNGVFSESNLFIPSLSTSRDSLSRSEHKHEPPRKLAKDIVDKLLRLELFRDLNPNWPPMPTNVCDKHLDEQNCPPEDYMSEKCCTLDEEMNSAIMVQESDNKKLKSRLQREISDFNDRERDYKDKMSEMEENIKDMTAKLDETGSENDHLKKMMTDVKNKLKIAEEVELSMDRNFKEKEKENHDLIKTASTIRGICSEQERTINGLRQCLNSEIERRQISGNAQNVTHQLQMEQSRLTEVEQVLRRRVDNCSVEVESLRTENIYLLERLKSTGEWSGRSGLKLDQELNSCVQCLKNMGLSLLNESVQTCEELLKIIGRKESLHGFPEARNVMQCNTKIQGFKQGLEQLSRSLRKTDSVLKEKTDANYHESEPCETNARRSKNVNRLALEDDLISELKAEGLLTRVLKEKLYFKEKEVDRVQAELARALRSNDVLKSEIQDAFDTVSCLNHKMKNFELRMIKKDGTVNELRVEMRSQEEELGSTKRTLSKVSQERDFMWEEVKQYSEKNMLLNHELNALKKKIDALEEDTLLKDGQISILKDSLSNSRPFDALFGTDQRDLFKL